MSLDNNLLLFPSSEISPDAHLIDIIHQSMIDLELGIPSETEQIVLLKNSIQFLNSELTTKAEKLELAYLISTIFSKSLNLLKNNFELFLPFQTNPYVASILVKGIVISPLQLEIPNLLKLEYLKKVFFVLFDQVVPKTLYLNTLVSLSKLHLMNPEELEPFLSFFIPILSSEPPVSPIDFFGIEPWSSCVKYLPTSFLEHKNFGYYIPVETLLKNLQVLSDNSFSQVTDIVSSEISNPSDHFLLLREITNRPKNLFKSKQLLNFILKVDSSQFTAELWEKLLVFPFVLPEDKQNYFPPGISPKIIMLKLLNWSSIVPQEQAQQIIFENFNDQFLIEVVSNCPCTLR